VARLAYVEAVGRHVKLGFDAAAYELLGSELAGGIGYVNPRGRCSATPTSPRPTSRLGTRSSSPGSTDFT